jgi:hypothetical protein
MDLQDALAQIAEIRAHISRTETFRGYRAATVAASGLLALVGAALQTVWIPDPVAHVAEYLRLWIGMAVISVTVIGAEIAWRSYLYASSHARQLTLMAVRQFVPSLVAGALLTFAVVRAAPESVPLLPGLWAIVAGLGVFASCRLLPPATLWIAVYYLVAGTLAILWARDADALSPWAMVGTFGLGQFLSATILHFTQPQSHGQA